MDFLGGLPAFLILIGVVVTIHELGHFLAAKYCGVGVLKFSVGFGPAIIKKRFGETEYQLSIIPLGGFVRMVGDMPDPITGAQASDAAVRAKSESHETDMEEAVELENLPPEVQAMLADRSRWFIDKELWQKALIVFAGPLFNFILAIFLVMASVTIFGLLDSDGTKMGEIMIGSPAERAGLKPGDEIVSVAGQSVATFEDVQAKVHGSEGAALAFEVNRSGEKLMLEITPLQKASTAITGEKVTHFMIGVSPQLIAKRVSFGEGIARSFTWVGKTSYLVVDGIVGLFRGKVSMDSLGGPILIYKVAGETAQKGTNSFLMFLAYINITLGILNLLPIPVLDGGHLVMFGFEAVFGSISVRKKEVIQTMGLVFLVAVMLIAFKNDLTRDIDSLKEKESRWEDSAPEGAPN